MSLTTPRYNGYVQRAIAGPGGVANPDLLVLGPADYATLDEDDFGVPGLVATEIVGPFVRIQVAGPLIMVHDGVFSPRHGIGHHPHRLNERLFYILDGTVDHDDSMNGITGHMGTGDVGCLTEGRRGMLHREWNNTDGPARAFILVYSTDPVPPVASFEALRDADAPRYEPAPRVETKELVGPKTPLKVNGDIRLFADDGFRPGSSLPLRLAAGEGALLKPLDREVLVEGHVATYENALLLPPADEARSLLIESPTGARVLRVVYGPGHGFVVGQPRDRR